MANKYTQKTQEALQQAQMRASAAGNPEIRPAHVLEALLKQQDGIAAPVLKATGVDPETVAREAGERGGTYPCAYNAANEVAVAAFLEGRIGFLDIAALVEDVLGRVEGTPAGDLDDLREADRRARDLIGAAWL